MLVCYIDHAREASVCCIYCSWGTQFAPTSAGLVFANVHIMPPVLGTKGQGFTRHTCAMFRAAFAARFHLACAEISVVPCLWTFAVHAQEIWRVASAR